MSTSQSPSSKSPRHSIAAAGEDQILTPGGWRPRANVRRLETGHIINARDGRLRIVERQTGLVHEDIGPVEVKKRRRPLPNKNYLAASIPDYGWIENVSWSNTTNSSITSFAATWSVPPPPNTDDNQSIFIFIGLQQSATGPYVLQPVLQWGASEIGGGDYWSISNWYVNGQGSTAIQGAAPIRVPPGQQLQASIILAGQSGDQYSYRSSFMNYPSLDAEATGIAELTWACIALEGYGASIGQPLTQCGDYPNTPYTSFSNIELKVGADSATAVDAPLAWSRQVNYNTCGQNCNIVSDGSPNGSVSLYYSGSG